MRNYKQIIMRGESTKPHSLKQNVKQFKTIFFHSFLGQDSLTRGPQGTSVQLNTQLSKFSICFLISIVKKYHYNCRWNFLIFKEKHEFSCSPRRAMGD